MKTDHILLKCQSPYRYAHILGLSDSSVRRILRISVVVQKRDCLQAETSEISRKRAILRAQREKKMSEENPINVG